MNYLSLPDRKTCAGCMGCVDACPHEVLRPCYDNRGFLFVSVEGRERNCIDCALCVNACPVLEGTKESGGDLREPWVFAAWSRNHDIRARSASGGFFASLAAELLGQGWLVWGASISGFEVKHTFISSVDDLPMLQGSKYAHGDVSGVYRRVVSQLRAGSKVLFSGLPCQCAALKLAIHGIDCKGRIVIVDMVCGGVPSKEPIRIFQGLYPDVESIVSYRDKDEGWKSVGYQYKLKVRTHSGAVKRLGMANPITYGFSKEIFRRPSCDNCQFSSVNRKSDLTIGDFWGITDHPKEHHNGVSGVMANTPIGVNAISSLQTVTLHPSRVGTFSAHNYRLVCSRGAIVHKRFKRQVFCFFFWIKKHVWMPTIILRAIFRVIEIAEGERMGWAR